MGQASYLVNGDAEDVASWGIPGIAAGGAGVLASWESAPAVFHRLGKPTPDYPTVPLEELPGYDEAQERFGEYARPYQWDDAAFLANRAYALNANPMRCVAGDTEVFVNRGGAGKRMQIRELVRKFKGGETRGRFWRRDVPTRIAVFDEESSIVSNELVEVHEAGTKDAWRLTTVDGDEILTSEDHQFRTPDGYKRLRDLRAGDEVLLRHREALPQVDHARQHAMEGAFRHVLWRTRTSRIAGIEPAGRTQMYDLTMAAPYHNYIANEFVVHNSGKSLEVIMGSVLAQYKRILVLCPSISKWVWADESGKWLHEPALVLEGTSNRRASQYCLTCKLSGRLADSSWCPECKARNGVSYGYKLIEVHDTEPINVIRADGTQRVDRGQWWRCHKHPEVWSKPGEGVRCTKCRAELRDAVWNSRITVVNYEILDGSGSRDAAGRVHLSDQMPGWRKAMSLIPWDLVVIDESHNLRGFSTDTGKQGNMLFDRVHEMCKNARAVWLVTGTPVFGLVRDLYGQFHVATGGLVSNPMHWSGCYAQGHKSEWGWVAKGRSNEEELQARLNAVMVMQPRSVILPYMPAKTRRVDYLEAAIPAVHKRANGNPVGGVAKLLEQIAPKKHEHVIERILPELAEGLKVYVLTFRPKHAESLSKKLTAKMNSKAWRTRMNAEKAEVFLAQSAKGIDPKRRKAIVDAFNEHVGAGVLVATIRSMPGSLTVKATEVHMVDFDDSPSSMEQAEDRAYWPGCDPLTITHYVVKGSIDDHMATVVLPKFETKDKLFNDENAKHVLSAFGQTDEELLDEIWARHTAHLEDDE